MISTAPGMSAPPPKPMPSSLSISRIARTPVTIAIGTFTKKIQCQLIDCVSTPPMSSPIVPPAEATKP